MSVDRVVMAFAGAVVMLSLLLAHVHNPNWVWLTAFVGANLFVILVGLSSALRLGWLSITSLESSAGKFIKRIAWEGTQLVSHSLAGINRELCLRLIDSGYEVTALQPRLKDLGYYHHY